MVSKTTKRKLEMIWNHQCAICGNMDFLEFHHLIPKNQGGTDDYDNLILLCACCHAKIHNRTYSPNRYRQSTSTDYETAKPILAAYFSNEIGAKETKEKLRQDLLNFYSGSQNAGKMLVLEGDIAVQSLALTPADINLIQNRNLTVTEIARFLNIPKHLLNLDRGQGTYSNITQERLQLIQSTLTPYVTNFQQALNNILLTPAEKKSGYHFSFDANETLKLTPQEQADYLVKLLDSKIMTANEVRRKLNMRPLEETELPADSDIILGEPLNENSDEGIKDGLSISETDANNIEV